MSPISINDVTVKFGNKSVLDHLSYDFQNGLITTLIGPSGAGKSTLIKSIIGMQKTLTGYVDILGERIPNRKILASIGYMAQQDALFSELTGRQNLEFFGRMQGIKKRKLAQNIIDSAKTVNLVEDLSNLVESYSGGMQRRLSLAIALQTDAPILILDEPTVGIDPELRQDIWAELRRQSNKGKTILITTHVMDEAERSDIVLMLRDGKFIAEGSPKEIKEQYQSETVEQAFIAAGKKITKVNGEKM